MLFINSNLPVINSYLFIYRYHCSSFMSWCILYDDSIRAHFSNNFPHFQRSLNRCINLNSAIFWKRILSLMHIMSCWLRYSVLLWQSFWKTLLMSPRSRKRIKILIYSCSSNFFYALWSWILNHSWRWSLAAIKLYVIAKFIKRWPAFPYWPSKE